MSSIFQNRALKFSQFPDHAIPIPDAALKHVIIYSTILFYNNIQLNAIIFSIRIEIHWSYFHLGFLQ